MIITEEEIIIIIKENFSAGENYGYVTDVNHRSKIIAKAILNKLKENPAYDYGTVTLVWSDEHRKTLPILQTVRGATHNIITIGGDVIPSRYGSYILNFSSHFYSSELDKRSLNNLKRWIITLNNGLK